MGLKRILGQPVLLGGQTEKNNICDVRSGYCVVYDKTDDKIFVLLEQEPCDDDIVTNGTFNSDTDWTVTGTDQWTIVDGKAVASVGTVETISQSVGTFTALEKFVIYVTVDSMTAGSLEVYLGGSLVKTITSNGVYKIYTGSTWGSDTILFSKSTDFDGSIDNVSLYKLLSDLDITASIINTTTNDVYPMNVEFFDEFVYISIPALGLAEGCYVISVNDPCSGQYTELVTDYSFDNPSDWTVTGSTSHLPPTATITGGKLVLAVSDTVSQSEIQATQPIPSLDGQYLFIITIDSEGVGESPGTNHDLKVYLSDGGTEFELFSTTNIYLGTIVAYKQLTIDPSFLELGIRVTLTEPSGTPVFQDSLMALNSVSIKYIKSDADSLLGLSNCLKVAEDTTTLKLIEGTSDEHRSLGFYFEPGYFSLKARLEVYFQNPHTNIKNETYLKSNGAKGKQYAQVDKAWDLVFGAVDENMHDVIANIISSDHFTIDGVEYICDDKDYNPNWGAKSASNVAESTIEVSRATGTRFNTNV